MVASEILVEMFGSENGNIAVPKRPRVSLKGKMISTTDRGFVERYLRRTSLLSCFTNRQVYIFYIVNLLKSVSFQMSLSIILCFFLILIR